MLRDGLAESLVLSLVLALAPMDHRGVKRVGVWQGGAVVCEPVRASSPAASGMR